MVEPPSWNTAVRGSDVEESGANGIAPETPLGPNGLGGWLILVILSLTVSPIRIAYYLATDYWPIFRDGMWADLTTVGAVAYHPLWATLLIFELVGNLGGIALAVVALVFLFRRSRRTPRAVIIWLLWILGFVVVDFFAADLIPSVAAQSDADSMKEVFRTLVAAALWIPYFLVSNRVRATFVR
jgi:hypothetical protein